MAGYERYKSLVQEAWQHYCQGDTVKMARSLEESLEYTPYLRSETVSDLVTQLVQLAKEGGDTFDSEVLSSIHAW
ncbi:MAG: glycosyltransferase family 2 protein, partial [Arthrospira sp. SH-MAG29]|nr:glycosyltransferase family 2 protein [Arthrospira sp. SH-MAG29]